MENLNSYTNHLKNLRFNDSHIKLIDMQSVSVFVPHNMMAKLYWNAYEKAMMDNGQQNKRHRIEHIEMTTTVDIERFNKLGVLPSMQAIHADPGTIDVWSKAIGEKRLPLAFPWASLLQQKK